MNKSLGDKPRPKCLLIRCAVRADARTISFQAKIEDEVVALLSGVFSLHVVENDFDLNSVCDLVGPDLIIFEGPGGHRRGLLHITNPKSHPHIARAGFQKQDPHDTARTTFLKYLYQLDVRTIFCFGASHGRQSPELCPFLITVPLTIDSGVFFNQGGGREIPISIFSLGIDPNFYNWRTNITPKLVANFPVLLYPHPGYSEPPPKHRFPVSFKNYASILRRSVFSVADSTREGYVVRKHLEIAACGAVLLCPQVDELTFYGFVDGLNCITDTGEGNFHEKIISWINRPDDLEKISINAATHVTSNYNFPYSHLIYEWYLLQKQGLSESEIYQPRPFDSLKRATPEELINLKFRSIFGSSELSDALDSVIEDIFVGGALESARARLNDVDKWLPHLQESKFLLAVVACLQNKYDEAISCIMKIKSLRLKRDGFNSFDPEELFWLWIAAKASNNNVTLEIEQVLDSLNSKSKRRLNLISANWESGVELRAPEGLLMKDLDTMQKGDHLSIHRTSQVPFSKVVSSINHSLKQS